MTASTSCSPRRSATPLVTADGRLVRAVRADPSMRFADLVVPLAEIEAPG